MVRAGLGGSGRIAGGRGGTGCFAAGDRGRGAAGADAGRRIRFVFNLIFGIWMVVQGIELRRTGKTLDSALPEKQPA